jgi:hypothetical protein
MSPSGHSRPDRAGHKRDHVRYCPMATKFCSAGKCRDGQYRKSRALFDHLVGERQQFREIESYGTNGRYSV